jgi:polysaccharide chain length determinant protein (PEP-CTERM system associated)
LDAGPGSIRDPRIEKLEESLSDLLSRYTEKHPEVIAVRRNIEAYRKGHESDPETTPAEVSGGTTQTPLSSDGPRRTSPALKKVEIDLAQQETDIAFYKGRIPRIASKIDELEHLVAQIPEVEAERTRLNRDYEVLRSKNNQLLSRREQAWISLERELRTDNVKFRILEPPRVPGSPTGPSRSLLLTTSLFGGIGAGIVFALLLGLLSTAVSDPEQLREWFGLPILGTVSIIDNFRHHSLRVARSSAFFACLALLFVVFAGLMTIERQSGLASLASNSHVNAAYEEVRAAPGKLKSVIADVIGRI